MRTRIAGMVAAALLAVSLTAAPAAAETVNESLEVLPALSVSIATGAVDYGPLDPGGSSAWQTIVGTIWSNDAVAMDVDAHGFDGTLTAATLPQDTREMCTVIMSGEPAFEHKTGCRFTSEFVAASPVYESTGPVDSEEWQLMTLVNIPSEALADAYTSEIVLTFYNL